MKYAAPLALIVMATGWAPAADATPAYALRASHACDSCHVEPTDWARPALPEQDCSVHCQSCHVSPSGTGLRTPAGQYYGRKSLPIWRLRSDGSGGASYQLGEGIVGWQPGSTNSDTVMQRYEDEHPDPWFAIGANLGLNLRSEVDGAEARTRVHAMARPADVLVAYLSGAVETVPDAIDGGGARGFVDEAFLQIDRLPNNAWFRAGYFAPPFGMRFSDDTAWTRRGIGFGKSRRVNGLEMGTRPGSFVSQFALFLEGLDQVPGDDRAPAFGTSGLMGWRHYGWQLLFGAYLNRRDDLAEAAGGVSWGLSLAPVTWLAEVDWRRVFHEETPTDELVVLQRLDWLVTRGVELFGTFERRQRLDDETLDPESRYTAGLALHPLAHLRLAAEYRQRVDIDEQELAAVVRLWF